MKKDEFDIQYVLKHFYKVPIKSIMDRKIWDLPLVSKDTPIEDIFSIMTARRHAWVMEKKGSTKLVGVITEKDLLEVMAPKRIKPYVIGGVNLSSLLLGNVKTAEDVMCKKLIVIHPEDTVEKALEKMKSFRVRRLPVVDRKGNLLGEITIKTLIIQFRKVLKWYRITKD